MKIGLVSDTHGNVDYLVLAAERLVGTHAVDRVFHLGGGSRDVEEVIAFKKKMLRGTEEYGDDAFLADVADFLTTSGAPPEPAGARGKPGDDFAAFKKRWTVVRDEGVDGQPEKIVDLLGSHIALVLHDAATCTADDLQNAELILHGKLGRFGVMEKKKRWFLCPGHLRDKEFEGRVATYGVLEIIPKLASLKIFRVTGELEQEFPLNLEKKGKMTVK